MSQPVSSHIPGIFIHVSDLQRSAQWYSSLLGLPVGEAAGNGHIYVLELANGVHLLLDSKGFTPRQSDDVLFMFDAKDVDAAHAFLTEQGAEIVTDIHRDPWVSFFNFKDPDGNVLMICQNHRK